MMEKFDIARAVSRLALIIMLAALPVFAQTKRTDRPTPTAQPSPTPSSTPGSAQTEPEPPAASKKNGRPADNSDLRSAAAAGPAKSSSEYVYEFSRPGFSVSHVVIRHDETGGGTISFKKEGLGGEESDPIKLSPATLAKINSALVALNFLDSTESYQFEKDFSHLGSVAFTYRNAGRERTAKYNWTRNQHARAIADEYRRVSNQYLWQFDMKIARENQPLEAPHLLDALEAYLRRNEISDPGQMLPLLKELSNDERIPLIARNRAAKLVGQIEKEKN